MKGWYHNMISYQPLLITLVKKNIKKTHLEKAIGISPNTIAKIAKNEYIEMRVLDRICNYLNCPIEDVIQVILDHE